MLGTAVTTGGVLFTVTFAESLAGLAGDVTGTADGDWANASIGIAASIWASDSTTVIERIDREEHSRLI